MHVRVCVCRCVCVSVCMCARACVPRCQGNPPVSGRMLKLFCRSEIGPTVDSSNGWTDGTRIMAENRTVHLMSFESLALSSFFLQYQLPRRLIPPDYHLTARSSHFRPIIHPPPMGGRTDGRRVCSWPNLFMGRKTKGFWTSFTEFLNHRSTGSISYWFDKLSEIGHVPSCKCKLNWRTFSRHWTAITGADYANSRMQC